MKRRQAALLILLAVLLAPVPFLLEHGLVFYDLPLLEQNWHPLLQAFMIPLGVGLMCLYSFAFPVGTGIAVALLWTRLSRRVTRDHMGRPYAVAA